jgi:DNA-binding response OmpR family regulator
MIQEPILLVDDEDDLRAFLKDALTQDGYLVDEAPDATTALALMARKHYPVVLTDLNMPGGPTGFDLIAAVKAKDPGTLCVVITGYASMETAIQAVKFGAYDFVQKPFKLAEIEAVLDRAINHAVVVGQLHDYQKDLETRVLARVKEIQELHDEMRQLNDLLMDSHGQVAEGPLLAPFLEHLQARFKPDGYLVLLPTPQDGWLPAAQAGPRTPELPALPPPSNLLEGQEWTWVGGYPEGHLVPLRSGGTLLGALFLGFEERSSFQSEAPSFVLWRRLVEAALHGLHRTRALVAAEVAKALAPGRPQP